MHGKIHALVCPGDGADRVRCARPPCPRWGAQQLLPEILGFGSAAQGRAGASRAAADAPPVPRAQNIKSTFTRAEKDNSIGAVLELKKMVSVVDCTTKVDHKGAATITLENGTFVPKREPP